MTLTTLLLAQWPPLFATAIIAGLLLARGFAIATSTNRPPQAAVRISPLLALACRPSSKLGVGRTLAQGRRSLINPRLARLVEQGVRASLRARAETAELPPLTSRAHDEAAA